MEAASLHRQLEFASAELSRVQAAKEKLETEASETRATEQAQRLELREESARSSRDGAVIRSLQQREASLLAQVSGLLQERDAATTAAEAHRAEAESLRGGYAEQQRLLAEERRQMQRLVRENAELRVAAQEGRRAAEAMQKQLSELQAAQRLAAERALHAPPPSHPPQSYPPTAAQPSVPPAPMPLPVSPLQQQLQERAAAAAANYPPAPIMRTAPAVPCSPPRPLPPPPQSSAPPPAAPPQNATPHAPPQPPSPGPTTPTVPPHATYAAQAAPSHPSMAAAAAATVAPPPAESQQVAAQPALRTAGMPAYGKRAARRGAPAPRALSFHLLSGEPLPATSVGGDAAIAASAAATSVRDSLVWENGCACRASSAPPPPPPAPPPHLHHVLPAAPSLASTMPVGGEVMPFARDDEASRRATEAIAPIERELMQLSMVKDRLEREYHRMPLSAGRTAEERRSKAEMEERLNEIAKRTFELKARLRALQPMRR